MKNLTEDLFTVFCIHKKQFQKISLGNHADLCKLCRVDSQKVLNVFCNIALFRLYSSVGVY